METLWQNLLADIDRQDTPTAQSALHTLLQGLAGDSLTEPALRHLILRLGLLSVAAPGAFITLRPLILAALSAAPSLARTLLQAQLAQDDGTPHADIIRHLVAQSDMELLQHIAGSVPSRTAPMIRKALNTAFLKDLADQNLHSARYIAAVALAAINESAADHLTQARCTSDSSPPSEAVSRIIAARVTRLAASHAPAVHRPRLRVALCNPANSAAGAPLSKPGRRSSKAAMRSRSSSTPGRMSDASSRITRITTAASPAAFCKSSTAQRRSAMRACSPAPTPP